MESSGLGAPWADKWKAWSRAYHVVSGIASLAALACEWACFQSGLCSTFLGCGCRVDSPNVSRATLSSAGDSVVLQTGPLQLCVTCGNWASSLIQGIAGLQGKAAVWIQPDWALARRGHLEGSAPCW